VYLSAAPRLLAAATTLAGVAMALSQPFGLAPNVAVTAGVALFAIGLWATGVVPEYLAGLAFFLVAILTQIAPTATIFSGFAAGAFWMVFSGVIIGGAVNRTGLGQRLARRLIGWLGNSYSGVVYGFLVVGTLLGFVMPSAMARVIFIMPIALAVADRCGLGPGSKGRTGIALAAALGTFIPPFGIMTGNIANLVMIGGAEQLYGLRTTYGPYLLLHFPVMGLIRGVITAALILWIFPDRAAPLPPEARLPSWSQAERRLAVVLGLALAVWATDFIHHVSPAWVGLGAAIVLLVPASRILPAQAFGETNWGPVFYVASILGFGAVVAATGLGNVLTAAMLKVLPLDPAAPARSFYTLALAGMGLNVAVTLPAVPAVMTPLAGELSRASGLGLGGVLMAQVVSFSTLLLPYQGPPLVVAMALGGVRVADGTKITLAIAAVTVFALLPLHYQWGRLLGWVP
jgi:di/tricarboxylate transporter